jgi:hypothetical protein
LRAGTVASIVMLSGVFLACSGDHPAPAPGPTPSAVSASLGGNVVARVADVAIDRALVVAVARAQKITADQALSRVTNDVLLAHAAVANGAEHDDAVMLRTATALSRAMLARLRANATATDFTDEEIAAVAGSRWLELDHPELRRVVHALVKKDVPNAHAVAAELRAALMAANAPTAAESEVAFTQAAKNFNVPSGPAVYVETLRIAEDGRVAEEGATGTIQEPFTKGTFAIGEVLGTSGIVETTYGFHVIRLLEKAPPLRLSREQKIEKLMPELVATRVKPAHGQLLNQLRAATKIDVVATDALLALPR